MILSIDLLCDTPIYTQICRQIIRAIAKGELQEGDELPSVRSLSADIGVNLHTVNKAYNALKQDGFLIVNRRKGVMVNAPNAYIKNEVYEASLKEELEVLITESIARGVDQESLDRMIKEIIKDVKGV